MLFLKLKILTNFLYLYLIGKIFCQRKRRLDKYTSLLPLTSKKLIRFSNDYQSTVQHWIYIEKKLLFLLLLLRLKRSRDL